MANRNAPSRGDRGRMNDPESLVLDELDLAILAVLPDMDEKYGKYLPKTVYSSEVRDKIDPTYSVHSYGQRLLLMRDAGYVIQYHRVAKHGSRWQRTEKGKQAIQ